MLFKRPFSSNRWSRGVARSWCAAWKSIPPAIFSDCWTWWWKGWWHLFWEKYFYTIHSPIIIFHQIFFGSHFDLMELVEYLTNTDWLKKKRAEAGASGTAFFPSWGPKLRILLVSGLLKQVEFSEFIFKCLISKPRCFFKIFFKNYYNIWLFYL